MYKLYKMQRTLKADVKTQQTANGTEASEGFSYGCPSFFTRIIAEYHGINVILGYLRNAIKLTNKKKKSVMLSNNPCEFAS